MATIRNMILVVLGGIAAGPSLPDRAEAEELLRRLADPVPATRYAVRAGKRYHRIKRVRKTLKTPSAA